MPPRGFGAGAVFAADSAMQCLIVALYDETVVPDYPFPLNLPLTERNQTIIEAYRKGETLERIAVAFHISTARVHQIVKNRR